MGQPARPAKQPNQDDRLNEVLRLLRLDGERYRQAGLLSHGQKQFLEIGACCWCRSRICCCLMSRRPA